MSTITRERLEQLANFRGAPVTRQEEQELARIALASLEAEPVAWIVHARTGDQLTADGGYVANAEGILGLHSTPLYTAPPAPVSVPDEDLLHMAASAIEDLLDHCDPNTDYYSGVWADVPAKLRRAAMLQGAEPVTTAYKLPFEQWLSQQNEPIDVDCGCVTTEAFNHWLRVAYEAGNYPVIPDGWVACSERMPEPGRWLALYGARVFTHGPQQGQPHEEACVDQGYLGSDGKFYMIDWDRPGMLDDNYNNDLATATHWMYWELPAAPQQEAK